MYTSFHILVLPYLKQEKMNKVLQGQRMDAYVFGQMLILAGLLKLAQPKPLAPAAGSPAN